MDIYNMNTTTLAYMGDAVFELYVRRKVIEKGPVGTDRMNKMTIGYVCAGAQCKAAKKVFHDLSPEEQDLVKRARNRKSATKPKNVSPVQYKWATALEALIGYLYLSNQIDRMEKVIDMVVEAVEEE